MEKNERLQSLDALRGFVMFWIIGGHQIFLDLNKAAPSAGLSWWCEQLEHAHWHGFHFIDMVFPTFLFIAGVTFPFSEKKRRERGEKPIKIYLQVIKRGALLVLLGMIYNGLLKLDFAQMRYASVLGRIGLAWMFAALLYLSVKKTALRAGLCIGFLIFYWLLLANVHAPDYPAADVFSMEGCIANYIDRMYLPGTLALELGDPEGILSTIPAISTAMLGMFTGQFLLSEKWKLSPKYKAGCMAVAALGLIVIGLVWDLVFPINKKLWTSSFVCFVGGLSLLLLALFYFIMDVWKVRKWAFFFTVIGSNSIFAYMVRVAASIGYTNLYLFGGVIGRLSETWQPLAETVCYMGVLWGLLYFLYRHKIFLKV